MPKERTPETETPETETPETTTESPRLEMAPESLKTTMHRLNDGRLINLDRVAYMEKRSKGWLLVFSHAEKCWVWVSRLEGLALIRAMRIVPVEMPTLGPEDRRALEEATDRADHGPKFPGRAMDPMNPGQPLRRLPRPEEEEEASRRFPEVEPTGSNPAESAVVPSGKTPTKEEHSLHSKE